MKKQNWFVRIMANVLAVGLLVTGTALPASAQEGKQSDGAKSLVISGAKHSDEKYKDYIFYSIPKDAPETVVLNGRDAMDFLLSRGQNNEWWPGTDRWAYLQIQNLSGYTYEVTDVSFDLDHTQKQEDSLYLNDYDYNPYIVGRNWADRPADFQATDTGAVGFDGYAIPSTLAPLRTPSKALAGITGKTSASAVSLEEALAQKGFAKGVVDYYKSIPAYADLMQGVGSFSQLPQYLMTDVLCGPTYTMWTEGDAVGDKNGNARWQKGDIQLQIAETVIKLLVKNKEVANIVPVYGDDGKQLTDDRGYPRYNYVANDRDGNPAAGEPVVFDNGELTYAQVMKAWDDAVKKDAASSKPGDYSARRAWEVKYDHTGKYRQSADVYAKFDAAMNPTYYYIDKNSAGEDKKDEKVDVYAESFEFIQTKGYYTNNRYFTKAGDLSAYEGQYWKNGSYYYMAETSPEIIKEAYDRFYADNLSFTFDYFDHPLLPGERVINGVYGPDDISYKEITEGSQGMHYADYMANRGNAEKTMDETIRNIELKPNTAAKRTLQLKLSGQNTPNGLAGTELLRGLTFQITLQRVQTSYSVEYYKDTLDKENQLNAAAIKEDTYQADEGGSVTFPAALLNKYRPAKGGYQEGSLQGDETITLQKDPSENVFRVLYTRDPYKVLYDANGGEGSQTDENSPYFADSTVTVLGQGEIVREGYSFEGWNTEKDGGGTAYAADDSFTMPAKDVTLYAQWKQTPYRVFYDANGGAGSQNDENSPYFAGSAVTVLGQGEIVREGYSFEGWNTEKDGGGTAYAADDSFTMPAKDVTLYAQWKQTPYRVFYDANGGEGTQTDENSPYFAGSAVTVLDEGGIAREGYLFEGWNTEKDGGGTAYAADDSFTMPAKDVTLYAQWKQTPYRVLYDANGGEGTQTDENSPYFAGSAVTVLDEGGITREGYLFEGWNTARDGSGTPYNEGDAFTMPKHDVVLYAQWSSQIIEIPDDDPPLGPKPNHPDTPTGPSNPSHPGGTITIPDDDVPLGGAPETGDSGLGGALTLLLLAASAAVVLKCKKK